jgi:hypothetical protein
MRGRRNRDRVVAGITTTYAISAYHQIKPKTIQLVSVASPLSTHR